MKKAAFKANWFLFVLLAGLTIIAIAFSGFLYHRNQIYLTNNRQLILQNDSIMSVNIELKKALQHNLPLSVMLSVSDTYKSSNSK